MSYCMILKLIRMQLHRLLFVVLLVSSYSSFGQIAGDYLIGAQMDIIKTDNSGIFE